MVCVVGLRLGWCGRYVWCGVRCWSRRLIVCSWCGLFGLAGVGLVLRLVCAVGFVGVVGVGGWVGVGGVVGLVCVWLVCLDRLV